MASAASGSPSLAALVAEFPSDEPADPDRVLDAFLGWVLARDLELYPAQEEALLELMAGHHLILGTPTGSGKSLVAVGLHFKAMCEGRRSFYTAPIKALVNEKFFSLCGDFGAENLGMLTGDATINPTAPIICCTAEVLANMVLRQGEAAIAPYVIMDEFHYYADPERGVAWQVPLLEMRDTTFLLMSATLGDMSWLGDDLAERTGREVATVSSEIRPVPLDYEYRETPIHQTVEALLAEGKAPIYIVHFTQRECGEQAQALTGARLCTRQERDRIRAAIGGFRFDSPYGKELSRYLRFGIAVHHAGLLPKYRLLVEQLSQRGLLKVICGTDTLGVGVNIPIRTVLFSSLSKFDGEKVSLLRVRDFRQISGRSGRKGFDDRGSVVCQAPQHVIEKRRAQQRAQGSSAKKRPRRKHVPRRGTVSWDRKTFERLIAAPPETLVSQFRVGHGMMINLLQREQESATPGQGYRALIELVDRTHERPRRRAQLRRHAAELFRSLRYAGIVEIRIDPSKRWRVVRVKPDLQSDFSLHRSLSLYLVEALTALDAAAPSYALEVLSLTEAILEDPVAILRRQLDRLKRDLVGRLKAEGVPYEERMRELEKLGLPEPEAEFLRASFEIFREKHPWVHDQDVRPKSIAREIYEGYYSFDLYVRHYEIARSEGLLLRYLNQVYTTLVQTVPESARTAEVYDVLAFFRTMLTQVDSSLAQEWQRLMQGIDGPGGAAVETASPDLELAGSTRALPARIRAELHRLVRALSERNFEEAEASVHPEPTNPWPAARLAEAIEPFFAEHGELVFDARARQPSRTTLSSAGPRRWHVQQVLVDPANENLWCIHAEVDLERPSPAGVPLLRLRRIGM